MAVIKKENLSQKKLEQYYNWCKIIQKGRANPVQFAEFFLGVEFMDYQRYVFMNSWDKQFVLWLFSRNGGKAISLDTKIPTPNGDKTMADIKVGDYVFSEEGKPVRVSNISEIFLNHKCYEVEFEDGEVIVADANHLWDVTDRRKEKCVKQGESLILTTEEMYNRGLFKVRKDGKGKEYYYRVPMAKPLQYEEKEFKIHPYVLGLWLGDGNSNDTRLTSHINDCEEINNYIKECGYDTSINSKSKNTHNINIGYNNKGKKNSFKEALKEYNLIKNKHIPEEYLYGSYEQRLQLLQGLMDTDGTCGRSNNPRCSFSQKRYEIVKSFEKLLSSLGIKYKTRIKKSKCNGKEFESYEVSFYTDKTNPCFKMKRKYDLLPEKLNKRMDRKTIIDIRKTPTVPTKCIMVEGEKSLYLCGEKNTVTHNSTLSAPFCMTKLMLFPNFRSYILSVTAGQSQ